MTSQHPPAASLASVLYVAAAGMGPAAVPDS